MKNIKNTYLQLRRKLINRFGIKQVFGSFDEALIECGSRGYNEEDIAKVVYENTVREKTRDTICAHQTRYHSNAYRVLLDAINSFNKSCVNILDFGGACGGYYFAFRNKIRPELKLKWDVVETKNMCKHGRKIENSELRFFEDMKTARSHMPQIDIINVSGSLQYVNDPYTILNSFLDTYATFILFSRMCFTYGNNDIVTIQKNMLSWYSKEKLPADINNKELCFPFTAIQKKKFDTLVQKEYAYHKIFADDSGLIRINNEPIFGLGLLCKRKI